MSKLPPFLEEGDLIIIVSPSGVVDRDFVTKGANILEDNGFEILLAPNAFNSHFKFGATHQQRLSDLQYALDHTEAKAIYCARGGFGVSHIMDELNWSKFKEHPKWIVGFSDITALLHAAFLNGYASLHASVLQGLPKLSKRYQRLIVDVMTGDLVNLEGNSKFHKPGTAKGQLIGGNLSLLVHQLATPSELDYRHKILFLEEVAEPLYHIDRMMLQLRRAGKLKDLAGLAVGQFSNLSEDRSVFGLSVEEIILAHCEKYDFPIAFNFLFGHGDDNAPIVHGREVLLEVNKQKAEIKY